MLERANANKGGNIMKNDYETTKRNAYKIVLEDMIDSGCGLFIGRYDAKNGSDAYMHGICTAMEYIAYNVGDEIGDEFNEMFYNNMAKSRLKVEEKIDG